VAVLSAGPYANLHLAQIDNHASTPPLSFYRPDALPCRPTNSIKALKATATATATSNSISANV